MVRGIAGASMLAVLGLAGAAQARSHQTYAHNYDQCWSATIRVLRVDYGFPVHDQDKDIGYLLFEYQDRGRSFPGSAELIRTRQDGREQVKVTITIPAMPSYIEQMILTRLARKLSDDFGEPPPPPRRPPERAPEPPPDAPDDGEEPPADRGPRDRQRDRDPPAND